MTLIPDVLMSTSRLQMLIQKANVDIRLNLALEPRELSVTVFYVNFISISGGLK